MNLISCSFLSFSSSKVDDSQNSIIWLGIDHSFTSFRNITNVYDALWTATGTKKGHKKEWLNSILILREKYGQKLRFLKENLTKLANIIYRRFIQNLLLSCISICVSCFFFLLYLFYPFLDEMKHLSVVNQILASKYRKMVYMRTLLKHFTYMFIVTQAS
jgi:predicted PurR-regulated permease PerM